LGQLALVYAISTAPGIRLARDTGESQGASRKRRTVPVCRIANKEECQMQLTEKHKQYWNINLKISSVLLVLWFVSTFVMGWFARELNEFTFLGPLGFYMSAQGSLIIYVAIIWYYAHYMNNLDKEYGVHEGELD
jgi:putative solute:sodium symporter small subunit